MNFVPDIMSIAKGLAAGVIPLAAAIYSDEVFAVIEEKHGAVATGHTFTGHTAACATGLKTQQVIAREGLVNKIKTQLGATSITFESRSIKYIKPIIFYQDKLGTSVRKRCKKRLF